MAHAQVYDYKYETSDPASVDWNSIQFTQNPGQTTDPESNSYRDRYYLNFQNSELSDVYVRNGADVLLNGAMYLQGNTNMTIGENSKFSLGGTPGKDIFLELSNNSSLTVENGATLEVENGFALRFWNSSNNEQNNRVAFSVNGGTFIGYLQAGYNSENSNQVNVEFKDGARFLSNAGNTISMLGRSKVTFDASSLETYHNGAWMENAFALNNNQNNANVLDTHLIFNKSMVKAGGSSDGTDYDFAAGDIRTLTNGSNLNFEVQNLGVDTNKMQLSFLGGTKVAAMNFNIGNNNSSRMGEITTTVKGSGSSFEDLTELAIGGSINMRLSHVIDETSGTAQLINNTFRSNLNFEGNTKTVVNGGFNIGHNEALGGSATVRITGDNNTISVIGSDLLFNAGQNNYKELGSKAKINFLFGEDENGVKATNSTLNLEKNFNIFSGGDSEIYIKFAGATNKLNMSNGGIGIYNSSFNGGNSTTSLIFTDGFQASMLNNMNLNARNSGNMYLEISNGANLTVKDFTMGSYNEATGGSITTKILGDGTVLTTNGGWNFNGGKNGVAGAANDLNLRFYFGKDDDGNVATNSTINYNGTGNMDISAGQNSDILVRFAGATNSFNMANGGINVEGNNTYDTGNSITKLEFTDGINTNIANSSLNLILRKSGTVALDVTNGAKLSVAGDITVGNWNEATGGTAIMRILGDNTSVTTAKNFNLNGGWNGLENTPSNAKVRFYFGKDDSGNVATNSTFTVNGNSSINSGENSDIFMRFSGSTNEAIINGGMQLNNSQRLGGNSKTVVEFEDGIKASMTNGFLSLHNRNSGTTEVIVKKGTELTTGGLSFSQNSTESSGTAESYLIIDGGSFITDKGVTGGNGNVDYSVNDNAASGTAGIKMTGDGGSFIAKQQMNINPTRPNATGGMFVIDISGTNNHFENYYNFNAQGVFGSNDAGYKISMSGYGNKAYFSTEGGNFSLGTTDTATAGSYTFESVGTAGKALNEIYMGSRTATNSYVLGLHGSVVDGTKDVRFILGGYTKLLSTNGQGIDLRVHEDTGKIYRSGTTLFQVRGKGNVANFSSVQIGNTIATGGTAKFSVRGGGSDIKVSDKFAIRGGVNTSVDNVVGGELEFIFNTSIGDSSGISTINVSNLSNVTLDGILTLDFRELVGSFENGISFNIFWFDGATSDIKSKFGQWISFDDDGIGTLLDEKAHALTRDDSDEVNLTLEGDEYGYGFYLKVNYTSTVPEPAAYAAIFGALAMAYASYRKRSVRN